ncbi:MAG: UbiA family prenyltransferase [Thiobacillaceae bacterium]
MSEARVGGDEPGFARRWNTYFAERFPPLQHGILIAAFSFGILAYTARLGLPARELSRPGFAVAFATAFLLILQLRILDEFKDYDEDARWRPYRPVPRGLVSLAELRKLWFIAAAVQVAGALLLDARLLWGLLAIWSYSGLMGVEFFVRPWLKAHALVYMLSHVVIVPLIAAYIAACDWLPVGAAPPRLIWLLAASYFAFCVIEVGRKIRAPMDEQEGVETYTVVWGLRGAVTAWLAFMAAGSALAVLASSGTDALAPVAVATSVCFVLAVLTSATFLRNASHDGGKRFNTLSGLWTLALFLALGLGSVY